jgi:3D (Asp-Asp-Asp) domain-containing protein
MMRRYGYALLFGLAACATASAPTTAPVSEPALSPYVRAIGFQLQPPAPPTLGPDLQLWATHYHTPVVSPARADISAAFPLLGLKGTAISPMLTQKDWCQAALQGSVAVKDANGRSIAYAFVDSKGPDQANCDAFLGNLPDRIKLATRQARFRVVKHPEGCGARHIPLLPYRTVAVDPSVIPVASVLYVPALRGQRFTLDGRDFVHDGYLFAGDRGGAIRGRHIDMFTAEVRKGAVPFPGVTMSTAAKTFTAHIVAEDDPAAVAVREAHARICEPMDE